MYAVVKAGGKQYRVAEGDRLEIEHVSGDKPELAPVLLVDGDKVVSGAELSSVSIDAVVVGEQRGVKVRGFTFKPKSNQRRRYGHRQNYSVVEIRSIKSGPKKRATKATAETKDEEE
jgi:large subunit ribosomal protein L21